MMTREVLIDRCRGALVGGAAGDALGYAVEFSSLCEIRRKYGENGITDYELGRNSLAEISDDTQMSLFTADGLLAAMTSGHATETEVIKYIKDAYVQWYHTQSYSSRPSGDSWLTHVRPLWARRAPGLTCLSALQTLASRESGRVANNSKGCGGVMRVAPIGIFSAAHPDVIDTFQAGTLAGEASYITHLHPLSTYSSMALAMIVAECIASRSMDREEFRYMICGKVFPALGINESRDKNLAALYRLVVKAMDLAAGDKSDAEALAPLGEGWVAEETLAIAIFSVMRHINDFGKCIVCAVNHDGDSDSTGAVAGNIIGAILGYNAIPEKYKSQLELHDLIVTVADDLAGMSTDKQMKERYASHHPYGISLSLLTE